MVITLGATILLTLLVGNYCFLAQADCQNQNVGRSGKMEKELVDVLDQAENK